MNLFRRRHRHPNVVFVDDATGEVLAKWAVRAGMLIVQTDYQASRPRKLTVRVQRTWTGMGEAGDFIEQWTNVPAVRDDE